MEERYYFITGNKQNYYINVGGGHIHERVLTDLDEAIDIAKENRADLIYIAVCEFDIVHKKIRTVWESDKDEDQKLLK